MVNQNDLGSIKDQGANIMLPARGNPFGAEGETPAEAKAPALPVSAMESELAPPPFAAEAGPLMPEDEVPLGLAAFSAAEESAAPAAPENVAPPSEAPMSETPAPEAMPVTEAIPAAEEAPASTAALESTPAEAAMATLMNATEASTTVVETSATTVSAAATTSGDQAGMRVSATKTTETTTETTLSRDIGPSSDKYVSSAKELTSDEALVGLFVPDNQMMTLWLEIEDLEKRIAEQPGVSEKAADQFFDRLKSARNMLMHNRDQYEDANREVAQVRYRLAQIGRSGVTQNSRIILFYLLGVLILLLMGFLATGQVVAQMQGKFLGVASFELVWQTILWGGVGGLTGAMYSLWRHVASERDYDPQFALWYYTNPVMGIVLGAFVYVLLNMIVLLAKGLPGALSTQSTPQVLSEATTEISPYLMYFFAWVVGFQQNFVFRLVDKVLKQVMPEDKDEEKK